MFKIVQKQTYTFLSHRYGMLLIFSGIILIVISAFQFGEVAIEWSQDRYSRLFNIYHDNIANKAFQNRMCLPIPIDAVYTWVNGSDVKLLEDLAKVKRDLEASNSNTTVSNNTSSFQCRLKECIPGRLLVTSPFIEKSVNVQQLAPIQITFLQVDTISNITKDGEKPNSILQFAKQDDVDTIMRHVQTINLNGKNYTLSKGYITSDWTATGSVAMEDRVLVTGVGKDTTEEDVKSRIGEQYQEYITEVRVENVASLAVAFISSSEVINDIVSEAEKMNTSSALKVSKAYLVWNMEHEESRPGEDFAANRFEDNEELRYSLRSIEKHAPWIRRIYIVTNGQIPSWLNLDNPRLILVSHDEIFQNQSHLPTFSSPAIESHIHRIPGLSKKFVYLNDDTLFGKDIWPDDFYTHASGQKVYLTWPVPNCAEGCPASWIKDNYCDKACNNSECEWDGGDCKGVVAQGAAVGGHQVGSAHLEQMYCNTGCANGWVADKYCDQSCNVQACGFDAGDCGKANLHRVYSVMITHTGMQITLPRGLDVAFFNVTPIYDESSSIKEGKYGSSKVVRTATIAQKFKTVHLLLYKNMSDTTVEFQILGNAADNTPLNVSFNVTVNTQENKNLEMELLALKNKDSDKSTNQTKVEIEEPPFIFENVPRGRRKPRVPFIRERPVTVRHQPPDNELTEEIAGQLKDLDQQLADGDLTQKGYDRLKAQILAQYLMTEEYAKLHREALLNKQAPVARQPLPPQGGGGAWQAPNGWKVAIDSIGQNEQKDVGQQAGQLPMGQQWPGQGQVPLQQGKIPLQKWQLPLQQGQVPLQQGQVPLQQGQLPLQQGQLPQQGQVPMQQGHVPFGQQPGQVPFGQPGQLPAAQPGLDQQLNMVQQPQQVAFGQDGLDQGQGIFGQGQMLGQLPAGQGQDGLAGFQMQNVDINKQKPLVNQQQWVGAGQQQAGQPGQVEQAQLVGQVQEEGQLPQMGQDWKAAQFDNNQQQVPQDGAGNKFGEVQPGWNLGDGLQAQVPRFGNGEQVRQDRLKKEADAFDEAFFGQNLRFEDKERPAVPQQQVGQGQRQDFGKSEGNQRQVDAKIQPWQVGNQGGQVPEQQVANQMGQGGHGGFQKEFDQGGIQGHDKQMQQEPLIGQGGNGGLAVNIKVPNIDENNRFQGGLGDNQKETQGNRNLPNGIQGNLPQQDVDADDQRGADRAANQQIGLDAKPLGGIGQDLEPVDLMDNVNQPMGNQEDEVNQGVQPVVRVQNNFDDQIKNMDGLNQPGLHKFNQGVRGGVDDDELLGGGDGAGNGGDDDDNDDDVQNRNGMNLPFGGQHQQEDLADDDFDGLGMENRDQDDNVFNRQDRGFRKLLSNHIDTDNLKVQVYRTQMFPTNDLVNKKILPKEEFVNSFRTKQVLMRIAPGSNDHELKKKFDSAAHPGHHDWWLEEGKKKWSPAGQRVMSNKADDDLDEAAASKKEEEDKKSSFLPWERLGVFSNLTEILEHQEAMQQYAVETAPRRRLLDTFGDSLRHVNKLFNKKFGHQARKVPAHMPHMIDVDIMNDLQAEFAEEYDITSSHKLRHSQDMQYAFSYFYYLMGTPKIVNVTEVFDEFDTDNSGVLSDREIRTLATRLYELPLDLKTLTSLEAMIINCSNHVFEKLIPPPDASVEKYYEEKMPQVTKDLLMYCPPLIEKMQGSVKGQTMYKYELMGEDEIAFKMIQTNVSQVIGQLDDIRKNPKKFVCLNDNVNHGSADAYMVKAVLQDFYESLFPIPSQFELPREYRNRFLHINELREWRRYRDWLRFWTHLSLAALITFSIVSFCSSHLLALKRRCCGRRWRRGIAEMVQHV